MRTALEKGNRIDLIPASGNGVRRTVVIERCLGMGASCIAYEVSDADSINYVLKECFPFTGAKRNEDGNILWKDADCSQKALNRFTKAYNTQRKLQKNLATENTNTHLVDMMLKANNTYYTLLQHQNAQTYDKVTDTSLNEIMITARAICRAIKAYHEIGYLHLDIKPENVMIFPETRDMVQLLDFDSLIQKDDVLKNGTLSCSTPYAAPELLNFHRSKIGEKTDVYSIGAVIYSRIFGGRTPTEIDRTSFCEWDFEENHFFEALSAKCKRLVSDLLHHTLCAAVSSRYSEQELLKAVNDVIEESRPGKRHLNSTVPESHNIFIGRQKELSDIDTAFQKHNMVILHGIGGIGKTEIALQYAKQYKTSYDVICFGKDTSGLAELFENKDFLSIENNNDQVGFNAIRGLVDSYTLLIIDNLDSTEDKAFNQLFNLNCKILITSRCDLKSLAENAIQLEICELPEKEQVSLFLEKARDCCTEEDAPTVKRILAACSGYTLLIPLMAQTLKNACVSLEELADQVEEAGIQGLPEDKIRIWKDDNLKDSVKNILLEVLQMTSFSEEEEFVLKSLSLLDGISIVKVKLISWIGKKYNDALNSLIERGWIQAKGAGVNAIISFHSVLSQATRISFPIELIQDYPWISVIADDYISQCKDASEAIWSPAPSYDGPHDDVFEYYSPSSSWPVAYPEDELFFQKLKAYYSVKIIAQSNLLYTIFREFSLEKIENIRFIVQIYWKAVGSRIADVCNFCVPSLDLFSEILQQPQFAELENETSLHCKCIFLLFLIRDLTGCADKRKRTKETVSSTIKAIKACFEEYSKDESNAINTILPAFYSIVIVGNVFGENMFLIENNHIDKSSANEFTSFLEKWMPLILKFHKKDKKHRILTDLQGEYKKAIGKISKCEFIQEWESYEVDMNYTDDSAIEELFYIASSPDVDLEKGKKIIKSRKEEWKHADEILTKCKILGYHPYAIGESIGKENPFNEENISKAATLLLLSKEMYEKNYYPCGDPVVIPYYNLPDEWHITFCIYNACVGNVEKAQELYKEYFLHTDDLENWLFDREPFSGYSTFMVLGLPKLAKSILEFDIQQYENEIQKYVQASQYQKAWDYADHLIKKLEKDNLLELAQKYKNQKLQQLNLGFQLTK